MKTNVTQLNVLIRSLLLTTLFLFGKAYAQPDYIFKNAVRTSGTNLQTGSSYKFPNVKPGVDALMTITAISPGITLTELDGSSGYNETLQPTIESIPWNDGYVEMTITFVEAGTTNPMPQPQVALTCIDVDAAPNADGNGNTAYEFDQIDMGGGYADYSLAGGELSVGQSGNMFTGQNVAGVDYPGRDTAAKAVMFTIVNTNVTTAVVRVGVKNQTNVRVSRLRSVYFKKFTYPNSVILALDDKDTKVKRIKTAEVNNTFKMYPTAFNNSATISAGSTENGKATLMIVDYSGRVLVQQQVLLNKGTNTIPVYGLSQIRSGNYIAVWKSGTKIFNQKLIKQ